MKFFGEGLFGAEHAAILSLAQVQRRHRAAPPDGYRILDDDDNVILRWLERVEPAPAKRNPPNKVRARASISRWPRSS